MTKVRCTNGNSTKFSSRGNDVRSWQIERTTLSRLLDGRPTTLFKLRRVAMVVLYPTKSTLCPSAFSAEKVALDEC